MASKDESLLPRLDRLDMLMGYLKEMGGCNKSSGPSTPSSGTIDGGNSVNSTPKSLEKRSRPLHAIIVETQIKGKLVDRLVLLEERVLKLEQEMESEKKEEEEKSSSSSEEKKSKNKERIEESCSIMC